MFEYLEWINFSPLFVTKYDITSRRGIYNPIELEVFVLFDYRVLAILK